MTETPDAEAVMRAAVKVLADRIGSCEGCTGSAATEADRPRLEREAREEIMAAITEADPEALTIADYEEVLADKRRLTRELDVLLNGSGAAPQASLVDIVGQVQREDIRAKGWRP